jgi:hypothetical protein
MVSGALLIGVVWWQPSRWRRISPRTISWDTPPFHRSRYVNATTPGSQRTTPLQPRGQCGLGPYHDEIFTRDARTRRHFIGSASSKNGSSVGGGPEPSVLARMINIRVGCRMWPLLFRGSLGRYAELKRYWFRIYTGQRIDQGGAWLDARRCFLFLGCDHCIRCDR